LAQERQRTESNSITSSLNLVSNLQELDEVIEFRLTGKDENLESVIRLFDLVALDIETHCDEQPEWSVDRENLEGIRVSTGKDGGLFLLRKSLHDPLMCLQVEATSKKASKKLITEPKVAKILDLSSLEQYGKIFLSKIMICILRTRITFINTAISSECV
jgi:phosphomannomutase